MSHQGWIVLELELSLWYLIWSGFSVKLNYGEPGCARVMPCRRATAKAQVLLFLCQPVFFDLSVAVIPLLISSVSVLPY